MPPLKYHAGQIAIQNEAKTAHIADRLAYWIGPAADFSLEADLILLAMANENGSLNFSVLSGKAPLVEVVKEANTGLRYQPGQAVPEGDFRLRFHPELAPRVNSPTPCGGLAFNYASARRARINGILQPTTEGSELVTSEVFTLCRKYIAPSIPQSETLNLGPVACDQIPLDDPWLTKVVGLSESMFLASISPNGNPDVSHRGGPTGFLRLDPASRQLAWEEFVGDGVFKSAGNIRATGSVTVLIPDLESGDGIELSGTASYCNLRTGRAQRVSPLEQHREDFPVQGTITCTIQRAVRLHQLMAPRHQFEGGRKITSCATEHEQAPQ